MLKFNEEEQGLGWKCQYACQTVTRGVFRWGCLQKLYWGLAPPGKAILLHLLLTNTDSIVCHPIKKQQLYWKKEWNSLGATFFHLKRTISHKESVHCCKLYSFYFHLLNYFHFTLKWCFACQWVLKARADASAPAVPVPLHRWASRCSPSSRVCPQWRCPEGQLPHTPSCLPLTPRRAEQWRQAGPGALRPVLAAAHGQAMHTSIAQRLLVSGCWTRSPWKGGSSKSRCSPPCLVSCSIFCSGEFVVVRCVRSGVFAPLCKLSLGSHCRAVLFLPHTSLPIIISFLNKRNLEALAFLPCK